jgi:flagellar M-ring protein FliF
MSELANGLLSRLSAMGAQRLLMMGGVLLAAVALLLVASWGGGPTWVPVINGVPLEKVAEVTRTLDEAKLEYRLQAGGSSVEVREKDAARARVELASRGLPSAGGTGFELFDQPSWGMTDFTQRINYRRALEGELERTIRQIEGVESARVHLALQQSSVLRRSSRPAEASVVVRMQSGARPTDGMVQGVSFLVASSVDELASDHVTVLDHTGRLLSRSAENGAESGLSSRQLEQRSGVERYLEGRAETLLTDMVGPGNVRVRVSAELNFDRTDRTVQAVNPDQQLMTREERTEIQPGPEDVGAASVAYKTDFEATRSVERFTSLGGETRRLTVAVLLNETSLDDAGPAVLTRVESITSAAIGLDPGRGDLISVVSVPFEGAELLPPVAPSGPGFWEIWDTVQRPVLTLLAFIMIFMLASRVLGTTRRGAGRGGATALPRGMGATADLEGHDPAAPLAARSAELRKQLTPAQTHRMQEVTTGVIERPDLAARVVQAWLKG